MAKHAHQFVPALGFDVLTPLYDIAVALTMRERAFKRDLIALADVAAGHRVLDLGSGTGTLAILLKASVPEAEIVGLDLDPRILGMAKAKAERAGVAIEWAEGSVVAPPFAARSFDRILSSLVFHHLTDGEKEQALAAARHLLRPGGSLHIADFAKPHNTYTRFAAALFRHFDGAERTATNLQGRMPDMLEAAGFAAVRESAPRATVFGTLTFVSGAVDFTGPQPP